MLTTQQFHEFLSAGPCLMDGATGSNLIKRGMPAGVCPESWILEHPQIMIELQKEYPNEDDFNKYLKTCKDGINYSIDAKAAFVEDLNPIILRDFNAVSEN